MEQQNSGKIYKIRVRYGCCAGVNAPAEIRSAVLKTKLPFARTSFNKDWPRVHFGTKLAGVDSECEFADIYFERAVTGEEVLSALAGTGCKIKVFEAKRVPAVFPLIEKLNAAERYELEFEKPLNAEEVKKFLDGKAIKVSKVFDNGMTGEFDLKKALVCWSQPDGRNINLTLVPGAPESDPGLFLAGLQGVVGRGNKVKIIKKSLYWKNSSGGLEQI